MGIFKTVPPDPTKPRVYQFVEAPAFNRYRDDYLDDEGFRKLQEGLAANPEAGDLVPDAGGVRKLRWRDSRRGKGRRSGLRIVYYCFLSDEEIWLLTLYDKDEMSDMTKNEKQHLNTCWKVSVRPAEKKGANNYDSSKTRQKESFCRTQGRSGGNASAS